MAKREITKGGGRGSKSEIVTIRLEPKLRYLTEIAARRHRRTLSSFIEWAIEASLHDVKICVTSRHSKDTMTVGEAADMLWDVDEPERFVKLALSCPELLNHHEQVLWKLLEENPRVWKSIWNDSHGQRVWFPKWENLNKKALRKYWDVFCAVARDEQPRSALPAWAETKALSHLVLEEDSEVADEISPDDVIPF